MQTWSSRRAVKHGHYGPQWPEMDTEWPQMTHSAAANFDGDGTGRIWLRRITMASYASDAVVVCADAKASGVPQPCNSMTDETLESPFVLQFVDRDTLESPPTLQFDDRRDSKESFHSSIR